MQKVLSIDDIKDAVAQVAAQFGVRRAVLYGSYANGQRTAQSDIDLFVEYLANTYIDLFTISRLRLALVDIMGKEVDLAPIQYIESSLFNIEAEIEKGVVVYEV